VSKILIIGSIGLIGSGLFDWYSSQDALVASSSRRRERGKIFVDLATGEFRDALELSVSEVFFCAAMTNIQACENSPDEAHRINVSQTLALIKGLVERGAFVAWLSSNTVFNGQSPGSDEATEYSPTTCYGRQKMETERAILGSPELAARVAIVRLSKVVSSTRGIGADFLRRMRSGESIEAFSDLYLSPVSLAFICRGLHQIAQARLPGIFHLSGEAELTYADFARLLADHLGVARDLVHPVESASRTDVSVLYRPRHPALRMTRTTELLGLQPESIASTLNELFPQRRQ
jgi:dTDP-4-dehydrorhamnose reductase